MSRHEGITIVRDILCQVNQKRLDYMLRKEYDELRKEINH